MMLTPERLALLDAKAEPNDHRTVYLQASELHELLDLLAEKDAEVERLQAGREVEQEMLRNALPIIAERDSLRARLVAVEDELDRVGLTLYGANQKLAAVGALLDRTQPLWRHKGCWLTTQTVLAVDLRALLAEPTSNEPQSSPNFDAPGPDPGGGVVLTDEEFAAFLKAAKG